MGIKERMCQNFVGFPKEILFSYYKVFNIKFDEKQSRHFRILYLKSNTKNIVKSQRILYTGFLIPEKPFSNGSASSLARALWAIDTDNMVSADTALMDSLKSIYGIITKDIFVLDAPLAVI